MRKAAVVVRGVDIDDQETGARRGDAWPSELIVPSKSKNVRPQEAGTGSVLLSIPIPSSSSKVSLRLTDVNTL